MANKGKRMLFENEYKYLEEVMKNNPDPSDIGGGSLNVIEIDTDQYIKNVSGTLTAEQLASLGPDTVLKIITVDGDNKEVVYYFTYDYDSELWGEIYYTNSKMKLYADPNDYGKIGNDGITINKTTGVYRFQGNGAITVTLPPVVTANTASTPTAVLSDLKVGDTVYSVGGKTYTHYIYVQNKAMNTSSCWRVIFSIQRSTNTAMTWADVCDYLESFIDTEDTNSGAIPATGMYIDSSFEKYLIYEVEKRPNGYFKPVAFGTNFSGIWDKTWTPYYFKDLVAEN